MQLICYPKCSTCAKAEKWLQNRELAYSYRDIKTQNPTAEELCALYEKSGLPLGRFFNTSGQVYRQLNVKEKRKTMSERNQLGLLATDGMLVKRPILVGADFVLVGFKETEWAAALSRMEREAGKK